jgi:hypothetical protein
MVHDICHFFYLQHASEVFGEKAILTTEARELQSRLQWLSDERNKYLVIIEEVYCFFGAGITLELAQ